MRKVVSVLIALVFISLISFGIYSYKGGNKSYIESNYHNELILKGIEEAKALTFDNEGKIYIALGDEIVILDSNRQKKTLFNTNGLPIYDLEYFNDSLYYTYGNKLGYYNITSKSNEIILDNIPNEGEYKECKILIKDNYLYLGISAATNSGLVDVINGSKDLSPKKLILSGKNYNNNSNGPFVSYGIKVQKGQEVPMNSIGNSSIIKLDLDSGKHELFCYGVRNIQGMDYNSEGKVFGVVGGIEDRGFRGLYGDVDYIYELKGGETWYGWPDYSGGDPVNSPRFRLKGKSKVNFILDKHPSYTPPAPFYQHDSISSLSTMSIDREGVIGEKNSIFTFDKATGELINILKEGAISSKGKLYKDAELNDIKIQNNDLYILDGSNGYLVKLYKEHQTQKDKLIIYSFFLVLTITMIITLVIKLFVDRKK